MNALCCETGRKLGEQFAEAARLYAEAVVVLTSHHAHVSWDEYIRLREAVEETQNHSEDSEPPTKTTLSHIGADGKRSESRRRKQPAKVRQRPTR
jgi:hypothetical protein